MTSMVDTIRSVIGTIDDIPKVLVIAPQAPQAPLIPLESQEVSGIRLVRTGDTPGISQYPSEILNDTGGST